MEVSIMLKMWNLKRLGMSWGPHWSFFRGLEVSVRRDVLGDRTRPVCLKCFGHLESSFSLRCWYYVKDVKSTKAIWDPGSVLSPGAGSGRSDHRPGWSLERPRPKFSFCFPKSVWSANSTASKLVVVFVCLCCVVAESRWWFECSCNIAL